MLDIIEDIVGEWRCSNCNAKVKRHSKRCRKCKSEFKTEPEKKTKTDNKQKYHYAGKDKFEIEKKDLDWITKISKKVWKHVMTEKNSDSVCEKWIEYEQRCWRKLDKKYGVNFFNYGVVGNMAVHK